MSNPYRRHLQTKDGLSEHVHFDHDGELVGIEYSQDAQSVVDWCKNAQSEPYGKDFRHVGRYPVGELLVFGKLHGVNDPCWYLKREYDDLLDRLIADSSHAALRVWGGRV